LTKFSVINNERHCARREAISIE